MDASDHRIPAVRDEFNHVVKGLLGRPCVFDAVAVGSSAHRNRAWWTNLIPGPLLHTMVERAFQKRDPFRIAQQCLDRGRTLGPAQTARAPGRHSVNTPGAPLKAFSTFVSLQGSHAYKPGQQSMVITPDGHYDEPNARERERAMGFMEDTTNTLPEPARRRLLGASMDMHAVSFILCSAMTFQQAFWHD